MSHTSTPRRGTLKRTLLAAVALLGLTAGSALAGDTDGRKALHATSHRVSTHVVQRHDVHRESIHRGGHFDRGHGYAFGRYARHHARHGHRARVVVHRHAPTCHYDAGHYDIVIQDVVIPGYWSERTVAARYEVRWDRHHGGYLRVLVRPARVIREWVPSRIEQRRVKRWVEGHWSCGY